jgi:hypothetical protein
VAEATNFIGASYLSGFELPEQVTEDALRVDSRLP